MTDKAFAYADDRNVADPLDGVDMLRTAIHQVVAALHSSSFAFENLQLAEDGLSATARPRSIRNCGRVRLTIAFEEILVGGVPLQYE